MIRISRLVIDHPQQIHMLTGREMKNDTQSVSNDGLFLWIIFQINANEKIAEDQRRWCP